MRGCVKMHILGKHIVEFCLDAITETVDGDRVGLFVTRKPDEVNIPKLRLQESRGFVRKRGCILQ